jgi:hypothetical protein
MSNAAADMLIKDSIGRCLPGLKICCSYDVVQGKGRISSGRFGDGPINRRELLRANRHRFCDLTNLFPETR